MSWRLSELTLDERRRTTNIYNVRQSTSRAINELNRDVLGMLEEAKVTHTSAEGTCKQAGALMQPQNTEVDTIQCNMSLFLKHVHNSCSWCNKALNIK